MLPQRNLALAIAFSLGLVSHTFAVDDVPLKISQLIVTPSQYSVADNQYASAVSLSSQQLEELPQIGDDLYRSIARLPGLATDDFTAKFSVRGTPFSEIKSLLDGVELNEPFHLKDIDGALSIVDPQIISSLQFSTGGFGVDFGGKLSGVLDMQTKSSTQTLDRLSLSLTGFGVVTAHCFNSGRSSILVSARRGYPDVAMHLANRYQEVTPRYYDLFTKYLFLINPKNSISLEFLHGSDTLGYTHPNDPNLKSAYSNDYLWSRWNSKISDTLDMDTVLSVDRIRNSRTGAGFLDGYPFKLSDDRRIDELKLKQKWHVSVNESVILDFGFNAQKDSANYSYTLSRQQNQVINGKVTAALIQQRTLLKPKGDQVGEFAKVRFNPLKDLFAEIGVRGDHANLSRGSEVNPRIAVSYNFLGGVFRTSWGLYSQVQELNELAIAEGEVQFKRQQRAEHRILSYEHKLGLSAEIRVEVYDKIESHIKPYWENVNNGYQLFPEVQSDYLYISPTRAEAKGVEILISNKLSKTLTWNFNYSLAKSNETINGVLTPRARDQRNTIYTDFTYSFNHSWQLSADWQYHTGWPTTNVLYSYVPLTNGQQYLSARNGAIYGLNLPSYHRLDLRLTHRLVTAHGTLRMYLDIFNAYNHYNLIGFDHTVTSVGGVLTNTLKPRDQLPLLPSAGLVYDF